jgi:hypothetical protein
MSVAPDPNQRAGLSLDLGELTAKLVLGILFALFAYAAFTSWRDSGRIQMLLLALQEGIIVWLVVTRRRMRDASVGWWDRLIATAGTAAPLLQRSGPAPIPELAVIGSTVQIIGMVLAIAATLSLGRSFGIVPANRGVQTSGPYSLVRHPLYGSYAVGYVGFLISNPSPLNIALIALTFGCQYLRAIAEERILAHDPAYQAYRRRVRYRFLPFVF